MIPFLGRAKRRERFIHKNVRLQFQGLSRYQGAIESPWDEIAIRYMLIAHHIAKRRPSEAFKEHTAFIKFVATVLLLSRGTLESLTDSLRLLNSLFYRFFATTSGWTLPALFAILRDLKDLAFDVNTLLIRLSSGWANTLTRSVSRRTMRHSL